MKECEKEDYAGVAGFEKRAVVLLCNRFGSFRPFFAVVLSVLALVQVCSGFSLLTHEQIVDILWEDQLQPMLLARFPNATAEDLRKAHAHAYGGSLIHDMGYYPPGNKFFTDLTHYVRSGDFVANLIRESSNRNEYAFALGALAHYASDNVGHPTINRAVALSFPKLRAKYGDEVTFADDPKAHIRTEFGFDMVQVAKNRYTSDRYHDFMGFDVSKPVLERAFERTYGLKLEEVVTQPKLAIGTFRRAVSQVLPEMTRVALATRRAEIVKDAPNFNEKEFLYHLSRSEYEKEWGKEYQKPGLIARIIALFIRWVPKWGPSKALAFKIPTTQTEDMYIQSVNRTVEAYRSLLREVGSGHVELPNSDCDTGREPRPGEYELTDKAYAKLLDKHARRGFKEMPPNLRENILAFYGHSGEPSKKNQKAWRKTQSQLAALKASKLTAQSER